MRTIPVTDSATFATPEAGVEDLGNQTLMDRTSQHRDAVPADLVAKVLAGDADPGGASRAQDIHIQGVPFLRRRRMAGSGHLSVRGTALLLLRCPTRGHRGGAHRSCQRRRQRLGRQWTPALPKPPCPL